jgi:hypothetical protein
MASQPKRPQSIQLNNLFKGSDDNNRNHNNMQNISKAMKTLALIQKFAKSNLRVQLLVKVTGKFSSKLTGQR